MPTGYAEGCAAPIAGRSSSRRLCGGRGSEVAAGAQRSESAREGSRAVEKRNKSEGARTHQIDIEEFDPLLAVEQCCRNGRKRNR